MKKTDAREIESYYQHYYSQYIRALDQGEQADRAQLGKAYQTAGVLFEVLCAVTKTEKGEEVAPEVGSWIFFFYFFLVAQLLFDEMPELKLSIILGLLDYCRCKRC